MFCLPYRYKSVYLEQSVTLAPRRRAAGRMENIMSNKTTVTVSTSTPAIRLREIFAELGPIEKHLTRLAVKAGARVIVYKMEADGFRMVDAEPIGEHQSYPKVELAEVEPASELVAA